MSQEAFESWLRGISREGGVAVLRHRVPGLENRTGGDWDLAARDAERIGILLEAVFGTPDLKTRRQYVEQRYYDWNEVDLLPVFEWNGIEYLDRDRFWARVKTGEDGLARPCLAHDAFVCWMTQVLWGGRYRERYDAFLDAAWREDGEEFFHCLKRAFGQAWAKVLAEWLEEGTPGKAAGEAGGLRRALMWRSLRQAPGECVWRQVRHWWMEWKNHVHPPYPWIAFLGPDGSGKSSVIAGVTARLLARRLHVKMIHWRPRLLRKGVEVPGGIVPDPHAKPPRGLVASMLKLALLAAEWWGAWMGPLRHPRAKSQFLFSDRYYADLLVDPRRYRYGAPRSWARAVFRFFPKPDRVVVLTGDVGTIHARKQEVTLGELERQMAAYEALAGELGDKAVRVDAGQPLERVIEEATAAVIATCRGRGMERGAQDAEWGMWRAKTEDGDKEVSDPPPSAVVAKDGLRVLVSAYACSPVRGAEANVGWNLVRELSQRHELWVMTRKNNRVAIEASGEPWLGRVRWVYLDPPRVLSFWRQGQRGIHPFYLWWQWLARREAKRLMREVEFDVAHHMTFGTYLVPSPLADLGVPLVFGPVGGGERTPPGLAGSYRAAGRWTEKLRDLAHGFVQRSRFLRHWYHATAWTLAATPVTADTLHRMGVRRLSMMPQSATGGDAVERFARAHPHPGASAPGVVKLVTASRLIHWKAIDLALEAVAAARAGGLDVRLTVLQEGPEVRALKRHTRALGLEEVVDFTGRLPTLDEVFHRMLNADALLHPALHEAFGQACLEALALGVPVICLNWGGPGLLIDESCGFKVEPMGREETVAGLAAAIRRLSEEKEAGRDFSAAARKRAGNFRWSGMARELEDIYGKVAGERSTAGPVL